MRKWAFWLGCSCLVMNLGWPAKASEEPLLQKPLYQANVHIDPVKKEVSGSIAITFWPKDPKHAYLHLYPDVFTKRQDGMLWEELLGKEPGLGTYDSNKLTVDGKAVAGKKTGHILEIPLAAEGKPINETGPHKIELDFAMKLPHNDGRMSYDEHAIWLGNWLPILAVYDQGGWRLDAYEPVGDPFYSEVADYEVNVTFPAGYQWASTAPDKAAEVTAPSKGEKTARLRVKDVRDFALVVMDASYQSTESKAGDTVVRTWWRQGDDVQQAKENHQAAVSSLAYFHQNLGAYPYTEYDVIRTGGAINGMEYPALVFLDGRHFLANAEYAIDTVVHETAHQWFYGLVGNDQLREAWLDEGFTEYATIAFLTEQYPLHGAERVRRRLANGTFVPLYVKEHQRPWQALTEFPANQYYSDLVYSRTTSMLWLLRGAWGEERLYDVLRQYVATYRYQLVSGEQWKAFLTKAAGEDASAFLDYWMNLDMSQQEQAAAWLERQREKQQK
ncbi:M1 family metallopeptidase [Brevibacillus parabrevis]|uniref:M1 family metallopeptidase n=1 Tax=Brevibacillus parabrevis TaxID=54914 RepID=UPI001C239EBC|nr:M1 family metallopeptidase [Brevibacillus parabrevis]MBU8715365.1 M1 family metallopeptidase [Brevibacillus parabrevis]